MSTFDRRRTYDDARQFVRTAERLLTQMVDGEWVLALRMGSIRREDHTNAEQPVVGDIDLLVTSPTGVAKSLLDVPLPPFMKATQKKAHGWLEAEDCIRDEQFAPPEGRMMIDAWWCPWESLGPFAFFLTGPMDLNVWMRQRSTEAGLMLTQYGLFVPETRPTKKYPNRKVTGERVDAPLTERLVTVSEAEERFWSQWCAAVGVQMPYPWPYQREEVVKRWRQERSRATRLAGTSPG